MKVFLTAVVVFLMGMSMGSYVYAASALEKFSLTPQDTAIGFKITYLGVIPVHGRFGEFDGNMAINFDQPAGSSADITVQTNSIRTGSADRDKSLRAPDLLDTDNFPTMTFKATKIEMGENNTGHVTGDLTLLGVTRSIVLNLVRVPDKNGSTKSVDGKLAGGLKMIGRIKRSDFGMNGAKRTVGDNVTLYVCYQTNACH